MKWTKNNQIMGSNSIELSIFGFNQKLVRCTRKSSKLLIFVEIIQTCKCDDRKMHSSLSHQLGSIEWGCRCIFVVCYLWCKQFNLNSIYLTVDCCYFVFLNCNFFITLIKIDAVGKFIPIYWIICAILSNSLIFLRWLVSYLYLILCTNVFVFLH